jgi:hypothetical protein
MFAVSTRSVVVSFYNVAAQKLFFENGKIVQYFGHVMNDSLDTDSFNLILDSGISQSSELYNTKKPGFSSENA